MRTNQAILSQTVMEPVIVQPAKAQNPGWLADYLLAGAVCLAAVFVSAFFSRDVLHWCIVPILCCGVIIGSDAARWLRGKYDIFDLKGLLGVYGVHFFFFAPLLQITIGAEMPYVKNPADWRPWLGEMAALNVAGLLAYNAVERLAQRGTKQLHTIWVAQPGQTGFLIGGGLVIALGACGYFFAHFGGFSGAAAAITQQSGGAMAGMGIPRILKDSLPSLCFFAATVLGPHRSPEAGRWPVTLAVFIVLSALQLVVSGLSTSRGEALTASVWMLMSIHYLWHPVRRVHLIGLLIPLIPFLWIYTFYKNMGTKVVEYAARGASISDMANRSKRSFTGMLLGDFARADIQAYIVYKQSQPGAYDLRYGATYLYAPVPAIPNWIWPGRLNDWGKVQAGSELLWGRGYYKAGTMRRATSAYGVAGEAMLNFGIWSAPVAYAFFGFLVGRFRRYFHAIQPGDLRFLVATYGTYFLVNMLLWDLDNYIAHTMIRAGFSIPVLLVAVVRRPIPTGGPARLP